MMEMSLAGRLRDLRSRMERLVQDFAEGDQEVASRDLQTLRDAEALAESNPRHSAVLYDPGDAEETQLTKIAKAEAARDLDRLAGEERLAVGPVQLVWQPGRPPFAVELHGQSSVTGHGKQGLRPNRIALLRAMEELGVPVLLGFCEGRERWGLAWLRDLPPATAVTHGDGVTADTKRFGWPADRFRPLQALELPAVPAPAAPRPQEELA